MSTPLSDGAHPFWGRKYPGYTASYTNEVLATPSLITGESSFSSTAPEAIDKIYKLGRSQTDASGDQITMSMLTNLLDTTKNLAHLPSMANPNLVSGCVNLMASAKPSVLYYEYGYVCFRILVISLNACILKHANCLDETISHMSNASKSRGSEGLLPIKLLSEHVLAQLLQLLYGDEKLFLVVSKRTSSLGLSGLMFVLFTHAMGTDANQIQESVTEPEEITMFDLHSRVAPHARLYNEKPVDVEDAINLSSRPVSAITLAAMLRFVAPLVVLGCEDLIPTTVKLCVKILWDSISSLDEAAYARHTVVDHIIKGDVLDLALRVFSTVSEFDAKDLKGTEGQLFSSTIEVYITVYELAPVPELKLRFFEAGRLDVWSKCYFYFRSGAAIGPTHGEELIAPFVNNRLNTIQSHWSGPKPNTMQGVVVKGDYRNPVEFNSVRVMAKRGPSTEQPCIYVPKPPPESSFQAVVFLDRGAATESEFDAWVQKDKKSNQRIVKILGES
ncbi:hypothetical protein B0J17DRAFT_634540 [Rhizoctonia solani]|nr:hypothetical protein B0J17DRAFT_634540 [Rhizoctonia solani]